MIDARIETAGFWSGSGSGSDPLQRPEREAWTLPISPAISDIAMLLLLTCAATISAVRVTSISVSAIDNPLDQRLIHWPFVRVTQYAPNRLREPHGQVPRHSRQARAVPLR
ncbi:hypothetical protein BSY18_4169 (plasmid) [Blastomonas sp. RAC04]|nr:hypothetical protein BSY18_4169 [Blastomonas sp. RAC04]